MEFHKQLYSYVFKPNFSSFHHYPSYNTLNYNHLKPVLTKDASTNTEEHNYHIHKHQCLEGSVNIVSYKEFQKLLNLSKQ